MSITPESVLAYTGPTDHFLCPLSANTYNIEFYRFTIRDMEDANKIYFDVQRTPEQYRQGMEMLKNLPEDQTNKMRVIHYSFPPSLLRKGTIGARLVFGVTGERPVKNFRMIERHYFRNTLIKSFDFNFGFCIPHSTNTWEAIYNLPDLSPEWQQAIVENPNETVSDSFYFVENELVMHNKAYYSYNKPE